MYLSIGRLRSWLGLLICILPTLLFAQNQDLHPKLGDIDPAWVELESMPEFEGASAVVLMDYGAVEFDIMGTLPRLRYTYHRRIKILDERAALAYSKIEIPYYSKENRETLLSATGGTIGINAQGESVLFKLDGRRIQTPKAEGGGRFISMDFPLVKVGSVIEFKYVLGSRDFQSLRPWYFQDSIPILESVYHAYIPSAFQYLITARGDIRNLQQVSERYTPRSMYEPQGVRNVNNGSVNTGVRENYGYYFTGVHHAYVMTNLKPWVQEEFSPEAKDFIPTVNFKLEVNRFNNSSNPNLFENWSELNRKMQRRLKVKRSPMDRKKTRAFVQRMEKKNKGDELALAQSIYEYVRSKYTWEDEYSIDIGNLKQSFDRELGNSGEINVVLLHLLREAGFDADPVLISTRDNGKVSSRIPLSDQFNHLIVMIEVDRNQYLLDALHDRTEFGVLPRQDLNQLGFLMSSGEGKWIRLSNPENTLARTTYTRFILSPDGSMSGEISVINKGYRAALERERLSELEDQSRDYFQNFVLAGLENYNLDNPSLDDPDLPEEPLVLECDLITKDFTENTGEIMIVRPILAWPIIENPFPQVERITPVDLTFPLQEAYMLGLVIPEGYDVEQLPEPIKVVMPNNAGMFTFNVFRDENILHITSVLTLNQTLFLPDEYNSISEFFAYVARKHEEGIVLKRQVQ
ncbi:MAG: DUF3857 domain-containing protein [Bacteroidota bacterium]